MPLNPFSQQMKPSVRVRQLWRLFEQWLAPRRAAMDQQCKQVLAEAEKEWKKQPIVSRKSSKEFKEVQQSKRREIEYKHFSAAREEWQKRLSSAGLQYEDWEPMTAVEIKAVEVALGAFFEEDEDIDENVVPPPQPILTAPPPPPQMSAPSLSTSSLASSAGSYELVNPMEFGSDDDLEDDAAGFLFNMAVSQDLTSEEEDLAIPLPKANGRTWEAKQSQVATWSGESRSSSHHNSQSSSPIQPPHTSFPFDLPSTSQRSSTASSSKTASAFRTKHITSSSASTSASAAAAAATKSRVSGPSYIGPVLSDAEDSCDEEVEFEKFKMQTRVAKIVEFHQAAAELDVKLAVDIYHSRKLLNSGKGEDARLVTDHEKKMMQLQREKEHERKLIVKEERSRRRHQIRHSSALRQPSRAANTSSSSWLNEYNNFRPKLNVSTPFDLDEAEDDNLDMGYEGPFSAFNPPSFPEQSQASDSLWDSVNSTSRIQKQKQKGKAPEPLVDHKNAAFAWGPQRTSFDREDPEEEEEEEGDFEVPEELRRAMNGFNSFTSETPIESPTDVATPKLGSNPWGMMNKTPTKSSPLATRLQGKAPSQSAAPPAPSSTNPWGKKSMQSNLSASAWGNKADIFESQDDSDPSWLQDEQPSGSPSFEDDSNSPEVALPVVTPAVTTKGKKAAAASNTTKPEQTSPPAPAPAPALKSSPPTKVEKAAPPPPPPPALAGKKQSKKQRAAAAKKTEKGGGAATNKAEPEATPPLAAPSPVVEEKQEELKFSPVPEPVPEPVWPAPSTSLWAEVSSTPRPPVTKAAHGMFGAKMEGTPRPSLLRNQIHPAVDTEARGATSSRTVLESMSMPSAAPSNGAVQLPGVDYSPIPNAVRQSIWGRASFTAESVAPIVPKPPPQTVRPPESEFWLPSGLKANGANGNGVGSLSNQFWKPNAGAQSPSLGKTIPENASHWAAANNPSQLRRNSDPVSPSPHGFKSLDLPDANDKVGPQSILKKTKTGRKKAGGKRVTIEEVSDEEGDGVLDGTLPLSSRSIMEPMGRPIHEPRPSVPPTVFSNIFDYGGDVEDDDDMMSGSSLVPTPSTAPTSPPDDVPPISEDWFAAATKQLNHGIGQSDSFNGSGWDATVKAKRQRWNSVSNGGGSSSTSQSFNKTAGYMSSLGSSEEEKPSASMSIPGSFPRTRVNSTGHNGASIWETQAAKATAAATATAAAGKKVKGKQWGPVRGEVDEGSDDLARFAKTQHAENLRRSKPAAGGKLF